MTANSEFQPACLPLDESGQATVEYALVWAWTLVVILASIEALKMAIFDFYHELSSLICLPIP